jgi:hypothetical protein
MTRFADGVANLTDVRDDKAWADKGWAAAARLNTEENVESTR